MNNSLFYALVLLLVPFVAVAWVPAYTKTCNVNNAAGIACSETSCLSNPSSWVWGPLNPDGSQTVTLMNCVSRTLSFISVGNCNGPCTKTDNAAKGNQLYSVTVPTGSTCASVCVYAHDGQYKLPSPNNVDVPDKCISSTSQRCKLCNSQFNICKTTAASTVAPTAIPTASPTFRPTNNPTPVPTAAPTTAVPTADPTAAPTTAVPSADPTAAPTTAGPTASPSAPDSSNYYNVYDII